jgi:hypothetical protein
MRLLLISVVRPSLYKQNQGSLARVAKILSRLFVINFLRSLLQLTEIPSLLFCHEKHQVALRDKIKHHC